MVDGRGAAVSARIVAAQPGPAGKTFYEVEISPDATVDFESLRFEPAVEVLDDGRLRCEKQALVGSRVRQCLLDRGHLETHQFQT